MKNNILNSRLFHIVRCFFILSGMQIMARADVSNDMRKETSPPIDRGNATTESIGADTPDALVEKFMTPPPSTKPAIYWYWSKEVISREIITNDMAAMAGANIGEIIISNVDSGGAPSSILFKGWWDLAAHAVSEGSRLGINVSFYNCPGWSEEEGLKVKPERSSRYLTYTETYVYGPAKFNAKLAAPAPEAYFQDMETIAFPAPEGDLDTIALHSPRASITAIRSTGADDRQSRPDTVHVFTGTSIGDALMAAQHQMRSNTTLVKKLTVDVMVDKPFTARSLVVSLKKIHSSFDIEAQASDGDGHFNKIKGFSIEYNDAIPQIIPQAGSYDATIRNITLSIPETASRCFRFIIEPRGADSKGTDAPGIVDIHVSAASRINRYEQKQFSFLYERAFANWRDYLWDSQPEPVTPDTIIASPGKIIDLARNMKDGTLSWDVPPGKWIILRVGLFPANMHRPPAVPDGTGLEIDRLNKYTVQFHDRAFVQEILNRVPAADRKSFRRLIPSEKNLGAGNWVETRYWFRGFAGYDWIHWLPVITGRVIDSADKSNRYLWQMRCLVKNTIERDYMHTRLLDESMLLSADKLDYGHIVRGPERRRHRLLPTTTVPAEMPRADRDMHRQSKASLKNKIPYVGYTPYDSNIDIFGDANIWLASTWKLKTDLDRDNCRGIDHLSFHVYPDNESRASGKTPSAFEAWLKDVGDWMPILRRQHALLQHGHGVAEIAYLTESIPENPEDIWPEAYSRFCSYYYISSEQILNELYVKDGFLNLWGGRKFRSLVIPPGTPLSVPLLKKIEDMVRKGGVIFGLNPLDDPDFERLTPFEDKEELKSIINILWPKCNGVQMRQVSLGRGKVINSRHSFFWENNNLHGENIIIDNVTNLLDGDLNAPNATKYENRKTLYDSGIRWKHRSSPDGEIFFLSNPLDEPAVISPAFRITDGQPELWDAVTGERRMLDSFYHSGNRTVVPLYFNPKESYFVIFRKTTATKRHPGASGLQANSPAPKYTRETLEQWRVFAYDNAYDNKQASNGYLFYEIRNRENENRKIYPSIPFRYKSNFYLPGNSLPAPPGRRLWINLGSVHGFARVRLNGHDLGTAWHAPWNLDITGAVCEGDNTIEIDIINPWYNRWNSRSAFFGYFSSSAYYHYYSPLNLAHKDGEKELLQPASRHYDPYLWKFLGPVTLQSNYHFK
jgi:hypothetical protein